MSTCVGSTRSLASQWRSSAKLACPLEGIGKLVRHDCVVERQFASDPRCLAGDIGEAQVGDERGDFP